ncbi:hypothetical protein [Streptomyces sp. NPDC056227]|uniref:hypothetical protein n=1 Tax=Streptomyces sp. NPDC056227 TaxID=3345753 RepID=UPI0035E2B976
MVAFQRSHGGPFHSELGECAELTSTEAMGWLSSAMRLGLAGGTVLAGPLGGHFVVPLLSAAAFALLLGARSVPARPLTAVLQ